MDKTTVVIGASTNTSRYSYLATTRLQQHNIRVIPVGLKKGMIGNDEIRNFDYKITEPIHTVTLYLNPNNQKQYYDYILGLHPKRIIFNPGTENPEFYQLLKLNNIEVEVACTLVLLSMKQY